MTSQGPDGYARGVKGEIDQRPRRFYVEVAVAADASGWRVLLDGRGMRTPAGAPVALPTPALAEAVADEWRVQAERIDLHTMLLTRLAYGAIDRSAEAARALAAQIARYAETDLVCHLADSPAELRDRQQAAWGPLRAWAGGEGVRLIPVAGVMPQAQPPASIAVMRSHAEGLDRFRLTGLAAAVTLCGSAVLGLAVERGRLTTAEAYELTRLDEAHQIAHWGEDAEARRRTEAARAEAAAVDAWFSALTGA